MLINKTVDITLSDGSGTWSIEDFLATLIESYPETIIVENSDDNKLYWTEAYGGGEFDNTEPLPFEIAFKVTAGNSIQYYNVKDVIKYDATRTYAYYAIPYTVQVDDEDLESWRPTGNETISIDLVKTLDNGDTYTDLFEENAELKFGTLVDEYDHFMDYVSVLGSGDALKPTIYYAISFKDDEYLGSFENVNISSLLPTDGFKKITVPEHTRNLIDKFCFKGPKEVYLNLRAMVTEDDSDPIEWYYGRNLSDVLITPDTEEVIVPCYDTGILNWVAGINGVEPTDVEITTNFAIDWCDVFVDTDAINGTGRNRDNVFGYIYADESTNFVLDGDDLHRTNVQYNFNHAPLAKPTPNVNVKFELTEIGMTDPDTEEYTALPVPIYDISDWKNGLVESVNINLNNGSLHSQELCMEPGFIALLIPTITKQDGANDVDLQFWFDRMWDTLTDDDGNELEPLTFLGPITVARRIRISFADDFNLNGSPYITVAFEPKNYPEGSAIIYADFYANGDGLTLDASYNTAISDILREPPMYVDEETGDTIPVYDIKPCIVVNQQGNDVRIEAKANDPWDFVVTDKSLPVTIDKTIKITLDELTGSKLGDATLTMTFRDLNVLDSTLVNEDGLVEFELTADDVGVTKQKVATNWDDTLNYRPIIHCDDDLVRFTFVPGDKGEWTIVITEGQKTTQNIYDEYMFVNGKWELIGNSSVDLTGYATEAYVNAKFNSIPEVDLTNCVMKDSSIDNAGLEFTNARGMSVGVVSVLQDVANKANASDVDSAQLIAANAKQIADLAQNTAEHAEETAAEAWEIAVDALATLDDKADRDLVYSAQEGADYARHMATEAYETATVAHETATVAQDRAEQAKQLALEVSYTLGNKVNRTELEELGAEYAELNTTVNSKMDKEVDLSDVDSDGYPVSVIKIDDNNIIDILNDKANVWDVISTDEAYASFISKDSDIAGSGLMITIGKEEYSVSDLLEQLVAKITGLEATVTALRSASANHLTKEVVDELPTTNIDTNKIYIKPKN